MRAAFGPTDQRLQPRQQFFGLIGFGQVIIDARIQPLDPVARPAQRREHQHWRVDTRTAQPFNNFQPVHIGQHAIKDDHVKRFQRRTAQLIGPAHFPHDLEFMPRQQRRNIGGGIGIILDIEQLHA